MNPLLLPGLPFLISMLVVLALGQPLINYLRSKSNVQPISENAPEKHKLKHGTPTMGGLLLLAGVSIAVLILLQVFDSNLLLQQRWRVFATLLVFLGGGMIGALDDLGKIRKKQNKAGLSEIAKLSLQLFIGIGFAIFLFLVHHDTRLFGVDLGWFYYLFVALYIAGFGNAVNFTDGLDGLASGTTLIVASTLGLATMFQIGSGTPELVIFYGAIAGACGGFLWFNSYPARLFMGDTGSLALGMGLAAAAIAAKQELLLFVVGVLYLAEVGSMMTQRLVFKYRKRRFGLEYAQKNRVFRRAPIHHHFEELGWHEPQVVGRFWVVTLVASVIGLLLFGGRN